MNFKGIHYSLLNNYKFKVQFSENFLECTFVFLKTCIHSFHYVAPIFTILATIAIEDMFWFPVVRKKGSWQLFLVKNKKAAFCCVEWKHKVLWDSMEKFFYSSDALFFRWLVTFPSEVPLQHLHSLLLSLLLPFLSRPLFVRKLLTNAIEYSFTNGNSLFPIFSLFKSLL